ncbi:ABC transporter transmembrane domain-containing protein [Proteus vulgaris]|uniref:peptidase domain-containing ABC transporter n=1 Tax=Proteus vulgaris TaxID=585 RepID=UPI0021B14590|nr:ABC transporter transmembrane domain-containing protein [Proteus vulgaris]MCT6518809.1 ABC transporter transmembrane domain-containing protein [Proteus vulgaris]
MNSKKDIHLIKSIHIIIGLIKNKKIKIDYNHTVNSLEKDHQFKLKKIKKTILLKKQINHKLILLDNNDNVFILLKNDNNNLLLYNTQTEKTEKISKDDLFEPKNIYHLDFKENNEFNIAWFLPVFKKYKTLFYGVFFYSLILQLLLLAFPLVTQIIMDKVIIHQALLTLDILVVALVFIAIYEGVLKGIREYIYHHTANKIDITLSLKLTEHLFKLPISYFKSRQTGAIVNRVKELDIIREFITNTLLMLIADFSFIFIFLFAMAMFSLKLTLLFIIIIPCYLFLAKFLAPKIEFAVQQLYQEAAINSGFLTESLGGIETIKSLSLEPRFTHQWYTQTHQLTTKSFALQRIDNFSRIIVLFINKTTIAFLLWQGAYEVMSLSMTIGQLIAFIMLLRFCLQPFATAIDVWGKYIRTKTAIYNLQDILNLPKEQDLATLQSSIKGEIIFNNVSFYYQSNTPAILNNISLHIKKHEVIGIVGTSGSGKSTLARMLSGLYIPQSGCLKIDGIPLTQFHLTHLRQQIGFVLQENFLFHLSVFDNIRLTHQQATLEDVIHVAKIVGAHEFILKLPLGYDTLITEGGSSLSGGQRQRIAIARALLPSPKILIFDEATSALDEDSQTIIQNNLPLITKDKTVIIIAHRLSTIRNCSRIIVLNKGQLVEEGKHEELIENSRYYKKLWQLQQGC